MTRRRPRVSPHSWPSQRSLPCVFVATAAALAFSDDSCDNSKPLPTPTGIVGSSYSHILKSMAGGGNGPPYSFVS